MTPPLNRRDFLQATVATTALAAASGAVHAAARTSLPKGPTDKVTLGKTGIQVSLVGMGTGSHGTGQASNQTRLGLKEFTRVDRHALDRGLCLFDVADQYSSHAYLREALRGVPRDRYVIQTKTHATNAANARSHVARYRLELGVDYIDILLLHCMTKGDRPNEYRGAMGYLMESHGFPVRLGLPRWDDSGILPHPLGRGDGAESPKGIGDAPRKDRGAGRPEGARLNSGRR